MTDTTLETGFLAAMDAAFADEDVAVAQGFYGVRETEESPAAALRYAALACRHHLRPLGRTRLGGSSGLFGNGMAFRRDVISAIGGTIKNICSKLAGATMERTAHQAITTVRTWMEIDSTVILNPVLRLKMTRLAMTEQVWAWRVGHHFCSHGQFR